MSCFKKHLFICLKSIERYPFTFQSCQQILCWQEKVIFYLQSIFLIHFFPIRFKHLFICLKSIERYPFTFQSCQQILCWQEKVIFYLQSIFLIHFFPIRFILAYLLYFFNLIFTKQFLD